jgi:hypothetical protein
VNESEPFSSGYGPLGVEGGIAKEKAKMDRLWQELKERDIPISVVVYPWPAQLAHDTADSRQVRIWRCAGRCKRFITLFPAFFAVKDNFIFGDYHYADGGNALVAEAVIQGLTEAPAVKREGEN